MTSVRELGRGERVLPGLWRLRLPLPWPGVPHCNAWAIAAGSGIVLVDTGMHQPGSMAQLERAMEQVRLRVEHVNLLACTHAHSDHWGQAATICDRAGCELWMHPNHEHATQSADDPELALARRIEVGRQSGVPEAALEAYAERARDMPSGIARVIEPESAVGRRRADRDRSRRLDGVRDARPRSLARVPVPARAPAADLRRPSPRSDLAVLRLRLDARPGRASSSARSTWSTRWTRGCACRATGSRSSTSTGTSRATASSSPSGWRRSIGGAGRASRGRRSRSAPRSTASR